MLKTCVAVYVILLSAVPVLAQTTGGATLAGGDNGHAAQADQTAKSAGADGMTSKSGSPGAQPGPGQSTEHSNGAMRASKNF